MFKPNRTLAIAIVSAQLASAPPLGAADRATLDIGGVDYYLSGHSGELNTSDDVVLTFTADLSVTAVVFGPEGEPAGETFLVGRHADSEIFSAPANRRLKIAMDGSFAEPLARIEADLLAALPDDRWSVDVTGWTVEHSVLTIEQPAGEVISLIVVDRVRHR